MQEIYDPTWEKKDIQVFVKRDDLIHPIISGNKWRKLRDYIHFAQQNSIKSIVSFGGAYSNHLYSLAYCGKIFNIKTIGIIRGDELNSESNPFLAQMSSWGMRLYFMNRSNYKKKEIPPHIDLNTSLIIPEGGYSQIGIKGIESLCLELDFSVYTHVITAVGTGTTLIGLAKFTEVPTLGILTLNNRTEIERNIGELLPHTPHVSLYANYIFGKYASKNTSLNNFISLFKEAHQIEIEPIYTGTMFYGLCDLITKNHFKSGSKILALHTGGIKLAHGPF